MTDKGSQMKSIMVENKGCKIKIPVVDLGDECYDNSPAKKKKTMKGIRSLSSDVTDGSDTPWADAVEEIKLLFTQYSEILQERAVISAALVEELENILTEAIALESELKEKKERLRQSLAIISDKLQG